MHPRLGQKPQEGGRVRARGGQEAEARAVQETAYASLTSLVAALPIADSLLCDAGDDNSGRIVPYGPHSLGEQRARIGVARMGRDVAGGTPIHDIGVLALRFESDRIGGVSRKMRR